MGKKQTLLNAVTNGKSLMYQHGTGQPLKTIGCLQSHDLQYWDIPLDGTKWKTEWIIRGKDHIALVRMLLPAYGTV